MTDPAQNYLRKARRAAERDDRMQVAWHLTQAQKHGADDDAVDAIKAEVTA
ncbi:hypothetical protein Hbl1158_17080 (plasmid) [Halobaculum sp. CBA1158]|uniref:hypothetical protein n=1 Tax=Halobaculum sp. CBA1158 TaxID=2904243 RepID=UPI001F39A811|nr:hypothetical protein [Halobaculum sp. CBA1158]UIP01716.1 hypothetical protein Hbl1158_17080 [Halobaculum sp. CBA1158]